MIFYRLEINTDNSQIKFDKITELLGWTPLRINENFFSWIYEVTEFDNNNYFDFINIFIDKISTKKNDLEKIGVTKDDLTFWVLYEYDQQCNLEFRPDDLKRLGDNGITLCISCWSKK